MFVGRKNDGTIYGVWSCPQPADYDHPGMEELADDDPEVLAFIAKGVPATNSAAGLASRNRARAIEDLEAIISTLPSAQREAFLLITQIIKEQ